MTRETYEKFVPMSSAENGGGHQSYIVGGVVTLSVPKQARGILWQALTQNVRYTLDGTTPAASRGFRLTAGNDPIYVELDSRMIVKIIAETAGAVLEYEYCRVDNGGTLG